MPRLTGLLIRLERNMDTAKAKALYDEVQEIVVNDAVEIYQVYPSEYHVRKDKIKGYGYYLNAAFRFRDWWIEE